jgi:hypothetical protein
MLSQYARVDREVVDALLRLALDLLQDDVVREILDPASDDHAVDRHGADRDRRVVDDGLPAGAQVAAGREVHQRVGAVALREAQLLDLLVGRAGHRRRADVGVDLGRDHAADAGRIETLGRALAAQLAGVVDHAPALRGRLVDPEPGRVARAGMPDRNIVVASRLARRRRLAAAACQVADVRGDHEASTCDLVADTLGGRPFALRHPEHLRGDGPVSCRFELCHRASLRRHYPDQVHGVGELPPVISAAGAGGSPSVVVRSAYR